MNQSNYLQIGAASRVPGVTPVSIVRILSYLRKYQSDKSDDQNNLVV